MTSGGVASIAVAVAAVLLAAALLLAVFRIFLGPTAADRVVALDLLSFLAVCYVALAALATGEYALIDATAIPALLGFVATSAFAGYLERRDRRDW